MSEKKEVIDGKYELLTLQCNMTEFLRNASRVIQKMIVQEEIFEAKKKFNEYLEFTAIKIRKFEDLMEKIKDLNPEYIVKDCLSCRLQFNQMLPYKVFHPIEILK